MTELVVISAADERALVETIDRLLAYLNRVGDVPLLHVALTCARMKGPCVLTLVVRDVDDLRARLDSVRTRLNAPSCERIRDKSGTYFSRKHLLGDGAAKLAFVYPGVMGFYPDMLRDLVIEHDVCRHAFDELEEALKDNAAFTPSSFVFPPAPYYRHDADIYSSGAYAQSLVATYAACDALTRLLRQYGVAPDATVGLAGGDLAAMVCSGAAGEMPIRPNRVAIVRDIYRIVDQAVDRGGLPKVVMVSVFLREGDDADALVRLFPEGRAFLTVDFSPRQKTFAIVAEEAPAVLARLAEARVRFVKLALDRPFNTPLCQPLVPVVRKFASAWLTRAPSCDVYSCATASRLDGGLKSLRDDTASRWAEQVRFRETILKMHDDGVRVFLEVGPRGFLTTAVEETLKGRDHAALALNAIHRSGRLQFQLALAQLLALGADIDLAPSLEARGGKPLDLASTLAFDIRKDSEMRLSRAFPRLTLVSHETARSAASFLAEPTRRGQKAALRHEALARQERRQRQFDFGAMNPLISDADTLSQTPGVSLEIAKEIRLSEWPFVADFALGTSQVSYANPELTGLVLLPVPVAVEMMAEAASCLSPSRTAIRIEDFVTRRNLVFGDDSTLAVCVRAERIASSRAGEIAVKVLIRENTKESVYTWPPMEAVIVFAAERPPAEPMSVTPLSKPRSVHWTGREIYPARLCSGRRLRGVTFVEAWSESGLDYQVRVPPQAGNVAFTRFPIWVVNPVLLGIIVSGFALWRSHERFAGAFSLPLRMRRMTLPAAWPDEAAALKCYLRLTSVTPETQLCDVAVTDGNGQELTRISGWEEVTERVPVEFCQLIMQPPLAFLTQPLGLEFLGEPATDVSSAFVTDIPYALFARDSGELWLQIISRLALSESERVAFRDLSGSVPRRVEWLFGRIAAKEAVRRFLKDFYQARWSDADVAIYPDKDGKPHARGDWETFLTTNFDIAIAHTAQFVVGLAAANARVGVDVESSSRVLSDEFVESVFTIEERDLAAATVAPAQAFVRFWCAKEAVSKALGTGIRYSPREMNVVSYVQEAGRLVMHLNGAWVEKFPAFRGRDVTVTLKTVRDHALASCFIPSSLFTHESRSL